MKIWKVEGGTLLLLPFIRVQTCFICTFLLIQKLEPQVILCVDPTFRNLNALNKLSWKDRDRSRASRSQFSRRSGSNPSSKPANQIPVRLWKLSSDQWSFFDELIDLIVPVSSTVLSPLPGVRPKSPLSGAHVYTVDGQITDWVGGTTFRAGELRR